MSEEPDYPTLAALRSGLTEDDADSRAEAYSSVLEADVKPSAVLGSSPDEAEVQKLVDASVIPSSGGEQSTVAERQNRIIELLEDIKEAQ